MSKEKLKSQTKAMEKEVRKLSVWKQEISSEMAGKICSETQILPAKDLSAITWHPIEVDGVPSIICFETLQSGLVPYWLTELSCVFGTKVIGDAFKLCIVPGHWFEPGTVERDCTILTPANILRIRSTDLAYLDLLKCLKNLAVETDLTFSEYIDIYHGWEDQVVNHPYMKNNIIEVGHELYKKMSPKKMIKKKLRPAGIYNKVGNDLKRSSYYERNSFVDPDNKIASMMMKNGKLMLRPSDIIPGMSEMINYSLDRVLTRLHTVEEGKMTKSQLYQEWNVTEHKGKELFQHYKMIDSIVNGPLLNEYTTDKDVHELCNYILLKDRSSLNSYLCWCTLEDMMTVHLYQENMHLMCLVVRKCSIAPPDTFDGRRVVKQHFPILKASITIKSSLLNPIIRVFDGNPVVLSSPLTKTTLRINSSLSAEDICIVLINPTKRRVKEMIHLIHEQMEVEGIELPQEEKFSDRSLEPFYVGGRPYRPLWESEKVSSIPVLGGPGKPFVPFEPDMKFPPLQLPQPEMKSISPELKEIIRRSGRSIIDTEQTACETVQKNLCDHMIDLKKDHVTDVKEFQDKVAETAEKKKESSSKNPIEATVKKTYGERIELKEALLKENKKSKEKEDISLSAKDPEVSKKMEDGTIWEDDKKEKSDE